MDMVMIESKQFQELLISLGRISDMLALSLVKDCETQKEKILALSSYGYNPADISRMLRTSANTVSNALSRAKKEKINKENPSEDSELKNE